MSERGLFLTDKAETGERLAMLCDSVKFAEYELAAGVAVARSMGMTWAEVGEVLSERNILKEGASIQAVRQWHGRMMTVFASSLTDEEHTRLARLIGAKERSPKWQVRRIVSGRRGISKVTTKTISEHLKREVAEARCDQIEAEGGRPELWRIDPDGREWRQDVRPREARDAAAKHAAAAKHRAAAEHDHDEDAAF